MRTNYILIDFENVQSKWLEHLTHDHFKVFVFVGASQAKVPTEFAQSLQPLGTRAKYITISGNGSNALDFHIAYYLGQLAAKEPSACFHIISKDKGYDPLIQHLNSRKILARRVETIAEIQVAKPNSTSPQKRIAQIRARLQAFKAAKPRTVKTLSSTINSFFPNQLSDDDVASLVQSLATQGFLTVAGAKVIYANE